MELKPREEDLETILFSLKEEKKKLEADLNFSQIQDFEKKWPHYSYIYPLVKEVHLLELNEKKCKKVYQEKMLLLQVREAGQQLLEASLSNEESVLKSWNLELEALKKSQPAVSTTSVESQEIPTVHNIAFSCVYDQEKLLEDLAVTVLYQAVHTRIKIHSSSPCSNIHFFKLESAEVSVTCDTYIPGLEDTVLELLESRLSVQKMVDKVASYIASDMAPFVISIPMRKKKSKSKNKKILESSKELQEKRQN